MYGTYFFALAGQTEYFKETIGLGVAAFAGTIASTILVTKFRRRLILLVGFTIQGVCMLIIAAVSNDTSISAGKAMVAFVLMFSFFNNACCAANIYLMSGEMPNQRLRSYTFGLSIAIAFFWNWLITYTAPYFLNPLDLNWVYHSPLLVAVSLQGLGPKVRLYLVRKQCRRLSLFLLLCAGQTDALPYH